MQLVKPAPYREAVDKIAGKTAIGSAMLSSEWSDVPVALRERAFFSSQVESVRFLQRGRDAIGDFLSGERETLPDGSTALKTGSRAVFVEQMRAFALSEGMGPLEPSDAGGLRDITSEKRLGLIFDVQTRQADDFGYWRQGMNESVLNEFPAQRFIRVQDVKVERELHIPYEDQVYLKTDPIWARVINKDFGVPWGPWGWGCGHDVEDVDRDEAEGLGLVKEGKRLEAEPKGFNENLKASASALDPDLLTKLKQDLGSQLVIDGDEMRWAPETSATPQTPQTSNQSPVSAALDVKVKGEAKKLVDAALSAIDRVHDDGVLPTIEVKELRGLPHNYGQLSMERRTGRAKEMLVNRHGAWPALTTVHESGHFLDVEAIGSKPGVMASRRGEAVIRKVLEAAGRSDAVKELQRQLSVTTNQDNIDYLNYLLTPWEIWARAYAQFVAERSGAIVLRDDLAKALGRGDSKQWTAADFAGIAVEIEAMFKKLGWMK